MKDDLISPRLESTLLRRLPCALDELNNRNTVAVAEASEDHSQRRGSLSLPRAGVDDNQALLAYGLGNALVLDRLATLHSLLVSRIGVIRRRIRFYFTHSRSIALQCRVSSYC